MPQTLDFPFYFRFRYSKRRTYLLRGLVVFLEKVILGSLLGAPFVQINNNRRVLNLGNQVYGDTGKEREKNRLINQWKIN